MSRAPEVTVRGLTLHDVDRILEIDEACTGVPRKAGDNDLWRLIAETTTCYGVVVREQGLAHDSPDRRSGVDSGGKLVGFVLADVRPWEFGNRAHVGWIVALGVDPAFQKHGVGKLLGDRVLQAFEKLGVSQFRTLVDRRNEQLLGYFKALGFREGRDAVLELGTK